MNASITDRFVLNIDNINGKIKINSRGLSGQAMAGDIGVDLNFELL